MFFFKKRKDDELRSPSGLGAVLHKTVMFVTYPFRKPVYLALMLVLVLAAVAAVPLYYGAEPQEVHTWYLDKIRKVKNADFSKVSDKFSKLIDNIPALAPTPDKGTDRLVEVAPSQREIRRQMFKAASGARPQRVDILAEEADDMVALTPPAPQMPVEEEKQPSVPAAADERLSAGEDALFESKPVIVKKVSEAEGDVLRYLDEPEEISGEARVYNANEMEVGGTYVFLYGVYSNPRSARGVKAAVFLRDALKGETVKCRILAYTADNVATGECFAGGISINKILVDRGFSDRVTLQ